MIHNCLFDLGWFALNCMGKTDRRCAIFVYSFAENKKTFVPAIPGNAKRVTGLRVHDDKLIATFEKSVVALWNLTLNQLLKVVDFGQSCKWITTCSFGLQMLTYNRKGYSKTITTHLFSSLRSQLNHYMISCTGY